MGEFKHLMKVFGGPMGGASYVTVRAAGPNGGKGALTIEYNRQTLTVGLDDLEETIEAVRKYYKKKLTKEAVRKHCKKKLTKKKQITNESYEIVSTVDTDSNNTWDKNYCVKIVNKKITRIGAIIKKSDYSYWFFPEGSKDPKTIIEKRIQEIMGLIKEIYPKFYGAVQKKVNNLA